MSENEISGSRGREGAKNLYSVHIDASSKFGKLPIFGEESLPVIIGQAEASGKIDPGTLKPRVSNVYISCFEESDRALLSQVGFEAEKFAWDAKGKEYYPIPPVTAEVAGELKKNTHEGFVVSFDELKLRAYLKKTPDERYFILSDDAQRPHLLGAIVDRQRAYISLAKNGELPQQKEARVNSVEEIVERVITAGAYGKSFAGLRKDASKLQVDKAYDDIASSIMKISNLKGSRERFRVGLLESTAQLRNDALYLNESTTQALENDSSLVLQTLLLSDPYTLFNVLPLSSSQSIITRIETMNGKLENILKTSHSEGQKKLACALWSYFAECAVVVRQVDENVSLEDRHRIRSLKPEEQLQALRRTLEPFEEAIGFKEPPISV